MRLHEVQRVLNENLPLLRGIKVENTNTALGAGKTIHGRAVLRSRVQALATIDQFQARAEGVLGQRIWAVIAAGDELVASNDLADPLLRAVEILDTAAGVLLRQIDNTVSLEDPTDFALRLPAAHDLAGLIAWLEEVQTVLEDPVRRIFKETPQVKGCEPGSIWLLFGVSELVLRFIFSMFKIAQAAAAQQRLDDINERRLKALDIMNAELESIQKTNARAREMELRLAAEKLVSSTGHDGDDFNEVVNAVAGMSLRGARLLQEGLRIQLAATAPETMKELALPGDGDPQLGSTLKQLPGREHDKPEHPKDEKATSEE